LPFFKGILSSRRVFQPRLSSSTRRQAQPEPAAAASQL